MPKKQRKFADDGWAVWVDGDDTSTVYINDWLNPKGKSYIDLAIRVRGIRSSHTLNVYIPFALSSEEIEEDLSYSFDYINQVLRKRMNTTVFKTLEAIRIENAKRLLRTTDLPLKLIAVRVGYNDEMYFSKVFKRRTDVTPAKYRKNGE